MTRRVGTLRGVLGALCILGVVACGSSSGSAGANGGTSGSSIAVSESSWHDGPWPFTVSQGILGCTQPPFPGAVTFNVDGTLYAVNGTAEDTGDADIHPIWKQAGGGLRVDIGGMIDKGLSLCPSG